MENVEDESNHHQTEVLFLDCIYIEERVTNHSPGPASSIFEVTTPTLLVHGFASPPPSILFLSLTCALFLID